ncbi:MAG: NFACT RNA binding domain-containing protein [bacterium]
MRIIYIRRMQSALHILSLVNQIKAELIGAEIVATEFYRKERLAYIIAKKDKNRLALGLDYHTSGYATYLIPASKIPIDSREKPWPFFELDRFNIAGARQLGLDRIFELSLEKAGERRTVVFEAIGPNGNLWLLDGDRKRIATLRKRSFNQGEEYQLLQPPDRLNPFELTADQIRPLSHEMSLPPIRIAEKHIAGISPTLAREVIVRAGLEDADAGPFSEDDIESLIRSVRDTCERFQSPHTGYLHNVYGNYEAHPFKLVSVAEPPEKIKTLSLAVMLAGRLQRDSTQTVDERKLTLDAVERAVKKLTARIEKIESDLALATDFDNYRTTAELLKINFDRLKRGMSSIDVVDVYTDQQRELAIALEPSLGPQENVEVYVKKYRKARDGHQLMQRRLEVSRAEQTSLGRILAALQADFDSARRQYQAELDDLRPRQAAHRRESLPRLPYREYQLSSGVKIYVGRDGSDNDRTTFDYAKPYELWFHAQQCPGSHVVMKFPNKSFAPSKQEIEQTAAAAAYFSKASKDSLVPVIYTERRHVHKPRKAKPGLVTVERETSVMVPPHKPETWSEGS